MQTIFKIIIDPIIYGGLCFTIGGLFIAIINHILSKDRDKTIRKIINFENAIITLKTAFNPFILELEKIEPISKNIIDVEIPKHKIAMLNFSHYLKGKNLALFNSERTWY